jgi:hypothetical protein
MNDPSHIVLRRPFNDDPDRGEEPRWEKVGFADDEPEAKQLARSPVTEDGEPVVLSRGDLLLALELEYLNPLTMHDGAQKLFVFNDDRVLPVALEQAYPGTSWLALWEGPDAHPVSMMGLSRKVPSRLLVKSLLELARSVVVTDADEKRPLIALDAVEAWCDGRGSRDSVTKAAQGALEASRLQGPPLSEIWAAHAAQKLAEAALAARVEWTMTGSPVDNWERFRSNASSVITFCISANPAPDAEATLASIIRRYIPLSVVLMSRQVFERAPTRQNPRSRGRVFV